jgi:hypothetical protein
MDIQKQGSEDPLFKGNVLWVISKGENPKEAFQEAKKKAPFLRDKKRYLFCRFEGKIVVSINNVREALSRILYPASARSTCNAFILEEGVFLFFVAVIPPSEQLLMDALKENEELGSMTPETKERIREHLSYTRERFRIKDGLK